MNNQKDILPEIERKVVRLVETRGVAAFPYRETLRKIERWVEKKLVEPFFTNKDKYVFSVPKKLTKEIDFIDDLTIDITLINDADGYHKSGSGTNTAYLTDCLSPEGKMPKGKITIKGFFSKKKIFPHTVYISLYHELNHAYEAYIDMKKHDNDSNFEQYCGQDNHMPRFVKSSLKGNIKINIDGISPETNNILETIAYRLFSETETNALIASVYGDFEGRDVTRGNFATDYKNTQAYAIYRIISQNYRNVFNTLTDSQLLDYITILKTAGIEISPYGERNINNLRKELIRKTTYLLKKLIRGIGKVASLYYDEKDKEEREKLIGNDGSITIR